MEVYCISLEKNKDNWPKLIKNISENGFPNVQIFKAVYGKDLKETNDTDIISTWALYQLLNNIERKCHAQLGTWGAVGCYLSHISIWQKMVEQKIEKCLIFEDDVEFENDFKEKFKKNVENKIPKDADAVFLDVAWCHKEDYYDGYLTKMKGQFFGTHAYIITLQGAQKYLSKIFPIEIQIDAYMSFFSILNNLNIYRAHKLCYQKMHISSIQKPCILCDIDNDNIIIYKKGIVLLTIILLVVIIIYIHSHLS